MIKFQQPWDPHTHALFKNVCFFSFQIHFNRMSCQLQSNLFPLEHFSHDCLCLDLQLWHDGATVDWSLGHPGTGQTNLLMYNFKVCLDKTFFRLFRPFCYNFVISGKMTIRPKSFWWFLDSSCHVWPSLLVIQPYFWKSGRAERTYKPTKTSKCCPCPA